MISGQNPQRILGCPICGYRVDPKDHICPRCGSEFYEGTKFECPLCGGLVSAREKICPSCYVDYSDFRNKTIARGSDDSIDALLTEIIGLESDQVKKEDRRYSCPNCSWMLDGSESYCPRCNHDLVADLSFQCPVCGTIVGSNSKACPGCGASFDEAEAEEKPQQEPSTVAPKSVPEPEAVKAPEPPPPPPEPPKEVKPIVIVKPPKIVAKPQERAAPEPAPEPVAPSPIPDIDLEEPRPEPPVETLEETLAKMETQLEQDEEIDRTSEQLAAMAQQPPKKGTKKRKLKAKPKR